MIMTSTGGSGYLGTFIFAEIFAEYFYNVLSI